MNTWWNDNWDKVLSLLVSVVLSGVIRFFSAVISIRSDIAGLGDRLTRIDTQISDLMPKVHTAEENSKKIIKIEDTLERLRSQSDTSVLINKSIELRSDQVKAETVKVLKELIEEARKQSTQSTK